MIARTPGSWNCMRGWRMISGLKSGLVSTAMAAQTGSGHGKGASGEWAVRLAEGLLQSEAQGLPGGGSKTRHPLSAMVEAFGGAGEFQFTPGQGLPDLAFGFEARFLKPFGRPDG